MKNALFVSQGPSQIRLDQNRARSVALVQSVPEVVLSVQSVHQGLVHRTMIAYVATPANILLSPLPQNATIVPWVPLA